MKTDQTELELLALPTTVTNPFLKPLATSIEAGTKLILERNRITWFCGRLMIEVSQPYPHFQPLDKSQFDSLAYPLLPGIARTRLNDIFACIKATSLDLSGNSHLILFGNMADDKAQLAVWDTEALGFRDDIEPKDCVWRSPYSVSPMPNTGELVKLLVNGNENSYDNIMRSLAPLLMAKKPRSVVWWIGDEHTARAMLMNALHSIFPDQLSDISLKRLTGGRQSQLLNDALSNVSREQCELRLDDIATVRLLSSHEDYFRHKYHFQTGQIIQGSKHHIFSAKDIDSLASLRYSKNINVTAIQFSEQPKYRARVPHSDICSQLIAEMLRYAARIK
jgi:hypothetical protein